MPVEEVPRKIENAIQNILKLERRVQTKTLEFFKDLFRKPQLSTSEPTPQETIAQATDAAVLATVPPEQETPVTLFPIEVSGFYKVTGPQEVTFYATTNAYTASQLSVGWSAVGITGIMGQLQVTGTLKSPGAVQTDGRSSESYLWSFTIQSDTDQSIQGVQNATGAILYPPGQFKFVSRKVSAPLYGKYEVISEVVNFHFSVPPPQGTGPGWIVENLPGINTPLRVVSYDPNLETYSKKYTGKTANQATYVEGNNVYENLAILELVDGNPPPVIDVPVYVHGSPAIIHEAYYSTTFTPGNFNFNSMSEIFDPTTKIILNQNIKTGNSTPLRDLNEGVPLNPPPVQMYIDDKDRGFSQGSILALNAIGPQENYLLSNDYAGSQFSSLFKQYTNFVQFQRVTPFPPPSPSYQGTTVQIELRPTELGHLISNMYLHVKMPAIKGYTYSEHIGRALIKQIDLLVNETVIETLYDDWYIIRDQLFLDASEQYGVYSAVNVQPNISAPVIGSGGTLATNATANTVHTFTTSTAFTLNTASTVNLLVVGGGGAGASGVYNYTNSANVYYSPASPNSLTVPLSSLAGAVVGSNTLVTSSFANFPAVSNIAAVSSSAVTLKLIGSTTWASYATGASTITVGSNVFTGTTVTLSGINPTTTGAITVSPAASSALVGLPATFVSQNVQFSGTVSAANSSTLTINPINGIQWIILTSGVNLTIYNGNGGGGGGVFNQSVFLLPGTYSVVVGAGGAEQSPNGGSSSFGGKYIATGGQGGAYGGASGTAYTSNVQFMYLSNTAYASGGGAGGGANVTTGTGTSAFTTSGTLGKGGIGKSYSNAVTFSTEYYGGGGGGSSNTSISGTLVTPGGSGGGGAGSSNITGFSSQNTAAISGTVNTGGGGGGAFGTNPGTGGSGVVVLWYSATANTIPSSEIITPLEFFFCRRHSANNKARERLRRPYFPLCAMWNQRMYVRFTFHPNVWWCNAPNGSQIDIYDPGTTNLPTLITEEILLNDDERMYYMNTPLKYIVPKVQKESTLSFSGNNPTLELTANFPVQTIAWFFRNKNYELLSDGRYSDSRYSYGYTTQYISTGIQLQFPSGNSNFIDVISTAKITLNNVDILSTFQGSLYYSFKQPIEHGLTIPSKNIYTYSFGLTPKEYNQGGYLNFSKLNSQTTNLQLVFNPQYTAQITQGYNLYLFYYGYTLLVFQGGFATVPFQ
jgi:Large eukaryotic DNA virus major capsid protein/Major capsid protein N-terminus